MFSLTKLAYHACSEQEKLWYDTVPKNVVKVRLEKCCSSVLKSVADNTDKEDNFDGFIFHTTRVCFWAAKKGHLDCLRLAHSLKSAGLRGFDWDEKTTEVAALNGHLDCLTFAHENGCPWSSRLKDAPHVRGHLECLKYAQEHENGTDGAASTNHPLFCLDYWDNNGREDVVSHYLVTTYLRYKQGMDYMNHIDNLPVPRNRVNLSLFERFWSMDTEKY